MLTRLLTTGMWFYHLVRFGFWFVLRLFYDLRIEGRANIPRDGGLVVASNHISTLDPPLMGVAVPREIHYMAKKELFENRWLAPIIHGLRAFPVDRGGTDVGAIKGSIRRLRDGLAVGIFVQGTRNAGDAEALNGAAFLAQRAGVPLLPAAIWREGRRYRVRFGEPLLPAGRSREEMSALTEQLMENVWALLPAHALPAARHVSEDPAVVEKTRP